MKIQDLQIVIADSSLAVNLKMKIQLEKLGCQVKATTDNAFRLKYLIEKLSPNLIIVDTELLKPSTDKYLAKLETPILFTTCYGATELLFLLFENQNTIGYLVKPLDRFSLYSSLRRAINFHQESQRSIDVEVK